MSRIRSVILDTSTLVSAALKTNSIPRQALMKALGSCHVCACAETLDELQRVLNREKFDRYQSREARQAFIHLIRRNTKLFALQNSDLEAVHPPCRDPRDAQFLALALVAEVDALVSSDQDLLVLHPWQGIQILTPAEFMTTPDLLP